MVTGAARRSWSGKDVEDRLPDGWHRGLGRRPADFFPSRGGQAAGLEQDVGDHRHQGTPV
jgi:hypothetical protein